MSGKPAVYVAIGITLAGMKEVLRLWTWANEGAKFWLQVLTEMQNRGLKDIFITCVDLGSAPEWHTKSCLLYDSE